MRSRVGHLGLLFFALIVSACGVPAGDVGPDPKNPRLTEVPSIDGRWMVLSKSCNGAPLPIEAQDSYQFDPSFFVHISRHSESAAQLCNMAHVYQRVLESRQTGNDFYAEKSSLVAFKTKKVCWALRDGRTQEPPLSTEIKDFEAPLGVISLELDRSRLSLVFRGSLECAEGELSLLLRRI